MFLITNTGRRIDPANPKPSDICLEDIASGLSKEERFDGNTFTPYTVAQHSCLVADLLAAGYAISYPTLQQVQAGLLHDATEAYLGDVVQPLKRLLPDYAKIEALWNVAIYTRFDLEPSLAHSAAVKFADVAAFQCECCQLVPEPEHYELTRDRCCSRFADASQFAKSVEDLHRDRVLTRSQARIRFLETAKFLGIT